MTIQTRLIAFFVTLLALVSLAACGGSPPATLTDIPAFPGATELKPGESPIGDTLAKNNQMDAALRAQMGTGGKVDQKGYDLPGDVTWDKVKSFYDEKLKASGWSTNNLVSGIMEQANQGNDAFQIANWQKDKQNVSVIMLALPTNPGAKQLIISLSSQ